MSNRLVAVFAPFEELTDPRIERTRAHDLFELVVVALCGTIAAGDAWTDIERFGNERLDWLRTFLKLDNGIPSHDTFGRVFAMLDPAQLVACVAQWLKDIGHELGQHIAIDGKTLRGSADAATGRNPLHLVSAWASEARLTLGQVAVDAKSNEITAIPLLLELLDLQGATVTIDAMGCQKEIARTIRDRKADYLLALKGNHEHLFEQVVSFFNDACVHGRKQGGIDYHREWSEGHGRTECRRCWATSDLSWLAGREEWADLRSVVLIESERFIGESLAVEERYYLSSLPADAELLNHAVQSHWGVENGLHWVLDVTFDEDSSRIRKENAPENFGLLRRLALCLLKKETTSKRSIKGKRLRASWDEGYLQRVLCGNAGN